MLSEKADTDGLLQLSIFLLPPCRPSGRDNRLQLRSTRILSLSEKADANGLLELGICIIPAPLCAVGRCARTLVMSEKAIFRDSCKTEHACIVPVPGS